MEISLIERINQVSNDAYFTVMNEDGSYRQLPASIDDGVVHRLFVCAELFPDYANRVMECRGSLQFILENTPETIERELEEYEALVAWCKEQEKK